MRKREETKEEEMTVITTDQRSRKSRTKRTIIADETKKLEAER